MTRRVKRWMASILTPLLQTNKQKAGFAEMRRGADETGLSQERVCLSIYLLLTVRPLHGSFVGVPLS